jgi:hypothetical protein
VLHVVVLLGLVVHRLISGAVLRDWHWHSRCSLVSSQADQRLNLIRVLVEEKRGIGIPRVVVDVVVHVVANVEHHPWHLGPTIRFSKNEKQMSY